MIDILYLAQLIQEELNTNTTDKKFAIYADEGDLRKSVGKGKYKQEWTSGVLNVVSDTFENLKDLEFQTINTSLMLFVDLQSKGWTIESENTQKQSINLIEVRNVVDETIARLNGVSRYIEDGNKRYNVTIAMNRAVTGAKQGLGEINDGIPLYLSILFTVFENGVNANDTQLKINGESVGSITSVVTMQAQFDQSEFATIGNRSYALAGGASYDLVIPLMDKGVTLDLRDAIHEKQVNKAWMVEFQYSDKSYYYICILAKGQITISAGTNIGLNVSFVEALEDGLEYDNHWASREFTGDNTIGADFLLEIAQIGDIIFWGDGTASKLNSYDDFNHTYSTFDTRIIRRYRE